MPHSAEQKWELMILLCMNVCKQIRRILVSDVSFWFGTALAENLIARVYFELIPKEIKRTLGDCQTILIQTFTMGSVNAWCNRRADLH